MEVQKFVLANLCMIRVNRQGLLTGTMLFRSCTVGFLGFLWFFPRRQSFWGVCSPEHTPSCSMLGHVPRQNLVCDPDLGFRV